MSDRVQALLIFMLAGLLSVVIGAGLITGELDPTAVALAICTLIGGIVTTLQLRKKPPTDDNPPTPPPAVEPPRKRGWWG